MFKLESYVTPLLMGYVDKYVKLKPEDLQVSLWGGDIVLNKLDLRLDAIEEAIKLPIMFKSGHIHELRIHVPWTRLASEPVVITINTIECVLKLRDTAHKDHMKVNTVAKTQKPKLKKPNAEELPPGYLQSMINRIVNNLKVVVNNLILKFVEDDIVLSLNIKSAECYSASKTWNESFIELAPPELVLRKVVDFHDLTVCLDKRDGSGKIENYQEPSLYRCSMTCRMHMGYDSLHAKLPSVTKMNLFCEKLDVSLTDTQLPMFWRLVELFLAIYYGTLELPDPDPEDADTNEENGDSAIESQTEAPAPSVPHTSHEGDQASWAGWAWSFVPHVLPTEEGSDEEESTPRKKTPPILAVGIYCSHASLVIKQTEHVQESRFFGPQKIVFKPFMCFEVHGIGVDVLLEGLEFLNGQFGIISGRVYSVGDCVCGAREDNCPPKSAVFFQSGPQDVALKDINFMSDSLFDDESAENLGEKAEFIFDAEVHRQVYTEAWASKKYGAFYVDYMYIMEEKGEQHMSGSTSSLFEGDESVQENSSMSFLIGGSHLALSSAMLHRVEKFVYASLDHEYEPYTKVHEEIVDDNRRPPTEEQVDAMERYVNTRTMHLTLVNPTVSLLAADHPYCDIKHRKNIVMKKSRRGSKVSGEKMRYMQPLPAVLLQATRFEMQLVRPMYPRRLVKFISKLKEPSSNLLHHCHTHLYIKIFGVQAGLYRMEQSQPSVVSLVPQTSGAYYKKTLVLPMYWSDPDQPHRECLYELPNFKVQSTNAQLLLLFYIVRSWNQNIPNPERIVDLSLLEDVFRPSMAPGNLPLLVASMSGLDLRQSYKKYGGQIDGTLSSFSVAIHKQVEKKEMVVSLLQGPAETKGSQSPEFFTAMAADASSKHKQTCVDVITVSTHLPKELQNEEVPSIIVLDVQGIVANLDPFLYEWLIYHPQHLATPRPLVTEPVALPEDAALEKNGSKDSQPTGSNATIPTDSQSRTQSRSIQPKSRSSNKKTPPIEEVVVSLGEQLAAMMALIRKLNLQVEFHHCCCLFPVTSLPLAGPTMTNITTLRSLLTNHSHIEMLVVCLPRIMLHSAGHKFINPGQELPLSNPEMLSTGDKLPWTLKMDEMSLYSFHPDSQALTLLKPLSLTCTLGITRKYSGKDHKELKSLGFCVHVDMESMLLAFSNQQVNLIYKLLQKAAKTSKMVMNNVQQFSRKIFPKVLKKSIGKKEAVPEEKSPSKPTEPPTESSQLLESSDPQDTATEDQSVKSIRPIGEILTDVPTSSAVQLSLWIQWTLPKFLLRLFRTCPSGNEFCISTDLEDLTTSIDVQEIYCKVKSKVGALNISHYEKKSDSWVPGRHAGVIVSTSGKLSKNITILNNKSWTSLNQPIINLYNIQDFKPRDSSHGFLNLTFTRALRKNVQKKMNTLKMTNSDDDILSDLGDESEILVNTYVDEICLNTQPFDAVAHVPIALHLVEIFAVHDGIEKVLTDKPVAPPMKVVEKLPWFQSDTLPLFYLNMANIRIFVPLDEKCDPGLATGIPKGEGSKESGLASEMSKDEIQEVMERKSPDSTLHHDMYVFQVLSVCLTPQPENPLPRSPVNDDLYRKLLQAGLSQNPGSEVEDRQYQLDLCGLGLCTGTWAEVDTGSAQCQNLEDEEVIGVQNPALEWNNLITKTSEEDVHLVPIATSVDLRIVAAPALVYKTKNQDTLPALVSGYSLEVNAISDIDFTLSTSQVKLLIQIAQSNIGLFSNKATSTNQPESLFQRDQSESSYIEVSERSPRSSEVNPNDSGVGSEASTLKTHAAKPSLARNVSATAIEKKLVVRQTSLFDQELNGKKLEASPSVSDQDVTLLPHIMDITKETLTIHPRRQPRHPRSIQKVPSREQNSNELSFTPFDVLLTAGKITLIAYRHSVVNKADLDKTNQSVHVEPEQRKSKGDLEWREEKPLGDLTMSDEFSGASFVGSDISGMTLLPSVPTLMEAHLPNMRYAGNQSESEHSCDDSDYVYQTIPFLFANFSQPHSLVNIKPNAQKVELSCYDFTLKGPKANHVMTDDLKVLPDFTDFPLPWLETRAGDANPKTGIPPSLYTLRITDFLQTPADISLSLERPLKFSVSISKLEQANEFMGQLWPFGLGEDTSRETLKDTKPPSGTSRRKLMKITRKHLGQINNLQVKTVQVVVVMETVSHDANAQVTVATSGIHGDVDITNDLGQASTIIGRLLINDLQCLTSYHKKTRPFIGPLTVSSTASATWCEHSGPSWVPRIIGCVDVGAFDIVFGQEHFMTFDLLRQHIEAYLQKSKSSCQHSQKPARSRPKKPPVSSPSFKVSKHSVDDLRRGAFQYIMEEVESTIQPNPNEVIFCSDDDGQCTMTWCYPEARMLTMFHVTPVPFNIDVDDDASFIGDESLKVGCMLQYWDAAQRDFIDWIEFYLSEQEPSEVSLPDIDAPSKVRVAQIWRVSMDAHQEKSDDLSCDLEDEERTPEPLVLPATLAASLRVDSAVVTDLIPGVQWSLSMDLIRLRLEHHLHHFGKGTPRKIRPFFLSDNHPKDQEYARVMLDDVHISFSHCHNQMTNMLGVLTAECSLLEYRHLTMRPVFESCSAKWEMLIKHAEIQNQGIDIGCNVNPIFLYVGQGALHTLNSSLQVWNQLGKKDSDAVLMSYYLLCNDTQESIKFGQVGTDECISMQCRQAQQYSWRSQKTKPVIRLSLDGHGWLWSEPIRIDEVGVNVRCVECRGKRATLTIKVTQLTSTVKQIATSDKGTDLYAWCHIFCQHLIGDATRLVVFSPVYVMRSHLPHPVIVNIATPETKTTTQLQVSGKCQEEQLTTLQADVKHDITFQIRPDSSPSHPPVSLSLSLLEQVKSATTDRPEIDALAYCWDSEPNETWFGYEEPSKSPREDMTSVTSDRSSLDRDLDQADLDLQVKFHQQWPGCNTIAMELVPWCLIKNRSALHLIILEDDEREWALKKDITWAPPKFLGTIKVGISDGSKTWFSSPISFSDKDTQSSQYLPHIEGVLYRDAHTYATVVVDGESDCHRVCYLVLKSTVQDSIQCVTISEKFMMTNLTKIPLDVTAIAVPLNKKTQISSIETNPFLVQNHKEKILQPLTYFSMAQIADDGEMLEDMAKYIRLKHTDNISDHQVLESFSDFGIHESDLLWSTPVRLKPTASGVRLTLSVPFINADCYTTKSYVLVLQECDGIVYMVLDTDDSPALMIHNFTDTPLHYGQTQVNLSIRGVSIFEDSEPLESLPLLPPGGSIYYTFPWQSEQYPQLDKPSYTPKLHLSGVTVNDGGTAAWSVGIDLTSTHDNIINVPNTLDVKVHVDEQCFTKHVFLEEVGRAEVSAKEIRNRIIGHEMVVVMDTSGEKKEPSDETTLESDVDNVLFKPLADGIPGINQDVVISSTTPDQMVAHTPVKFKHYKHCRAKSGRFVAHALFKHVCVIMLDDTATDRTLEVLRVVLDNLFILGQPGAASGAKPSPHDMSVICCVSRAQVDNQMYQSRLYDFPVILQQQEEQKADELQLDFEEVLDFLDEIEKRSFIWMKFQIDHGAVGLGSQIVTAELAVKPISLFIEDNYIYNMLKRIDAFIPTRLSTRNFGKGKNVLPKSVEFATQCLLRPIRLEQLLIHPIIMCLSVHASLKLFLASENTPLKFGKFEKQALFTSSQRLIRALAMHYASAALFRAGLVVGSLEILGNPTGLVRNIGSGVADLFRMPLEGITKGPGSFLSGITHGFSSLLWHTSTGALTSVTNFASSVSRNMDRLSMDNDHFRRQEETRRQRPDRLATGIKQGLTGFGISLLGAVAGLADQPLQSIQQTSSPDRASSSTQKAAGFISGVGKGLIGVVTKPVGGAAEFVSQTGQGLLHGVGMAKLSKTIYPSISMPTDTAVNSTVKFLWKILQNIPSTDILCILEATTMSSVGPVSEVYLVLTPETVFMVNVAEDMAIQAFAVPEMECRRRSSAPDTLLVHLLNKKDDQQTEKNESAKERVAEFISGEADSDTQVSDILSDSSTDMMHLSVARHEFRTDPNVLEIFLAHLHLTKRQLQLKGFPL
ncbi:intermembrane lipid transfer protein VPS13B-like isoform X2 [Lineus longissimus]|uniref:intermembrane lipid transfer protein VPS13B-like isoform X2 n=1 Tax=Lineus longissimus TaxID=88925 RepID=UPI00315DF59D